MIGKCAGEIWSLSNVRVRRVSIRSLNFDLVALCLSCNLLEAVLMMDNNFNIRVYKLAIQAESFTFKMFAFFYWLWLSRCFFLHWLWRFYFILFILTLNLLHFRLNILNLHIIVKSPLRKNTSKDFFFFLFELLQCCGNVDKFLLGLGILRV